MIEIDRPTFGLGYALTITPPPEIDFFHTGDTLHEIVKFGMDELTEGKKKYHTP